MLIPAAAPDYLQADFQTTTAYAVPVRLCAPLSEARYTIEAALPTAHRGRSTWAFSCSEPCLVITRCTISGALVASQGRLVYPGMRYSLQRPYESRTPQSWQHVALATYRAQPLEQRRRHYP
jgi:GntR family histidine utilization transcriptional repressor